MSARVLEAPQTESKHRGHNCDFPPIVDTTMAFNQRLIFGGVVKKSLPKKTKGIGMHFFSIISFNPYSIRLLLYIIYTTSKLCMCLVACDFWIEVMNLIKTIVISLSNLVGRYMSLYLCSGR